MPKKKPIAIVVRRGALRRFDALTRKTAELPVDVTWDRRVDERRATGETASVERRSGDRRREQPFTWQVADFVVVDGREPAPKSLHEPEKWIGPEQTEHGGDTADGE